MKKMGLKLLITLFTTSFILVGCGTATTGSNNTNKFVVGMECNYAPYNWTESTAKSDSSVAIAGGQYCDGFDVIVAQKIATGLGKELVIEKTAWDGLIPSLQSGLIDAIIAGMSPTIERREEIAFSNTYYVGEFGVIINKSGNYATAQSVTDFTNAKMTAQLGTFHVDLLTQFPGATILSPMKDFPTMTVAAKSGEIDAFIADDATGPAIAEANPDLAFILLSGAKGIQTNPDQTGVAVGLRKEDTELTAEVNKILANISETDMRGYMVAAKNRQPGE